MESIIFRRHKVSVYTLIIWIEISNHLNCNIDENILLVISAYDAIAKHGIHTKYGEGKWVLDVDANQTSGGVSERSLVSSQWRGESRIVYQQSCPFVNWLQAVGLGNQDVGTARRSLGTRSADRQERAFCPERSMGKTWFRTRPFCPVGASGIGLWRWAYFGRIGLECSGTLSWRIETGICE